MHTDLLVIGAGGHGKVVLSVVESVGGRVIAIYDDDPAKAEMVFRGVTVSALATLDWVSARSHPIHVAIGDNEIRSRIAKKVLDNAMSLAVLIHPTAVVDAEAVIGAGSLVAPGGIVASGAMVGKATIINHRAIVDHDCQVGNFCHIAPGAILGGGVQLDDHVLIGAGAIGLARTFNRERRCDWRRVDSYPFRR